MTYSQYGEDDIVDALLGHPEDGTVVDIGAGDGLEISNSRLFRERGWDAVLVEPDVRHRDALARLHMPPRVTVVTEAATPENINQLVPKFARVLSIDVDGDDYFLLEALVRRPNVIVVEHNPTIPYERDVCPSRPGLRVGASVAALCRLAAGKGYGLQAVTECNAIFAFNRPDIPIPAHRPAWGVMTDYFTGRPFVVGEAPWGVDFSDPLDPGDVVVR